MKKKLPQILVQFFKLLTIIYLAVIPSIGKKRNKADRQGIRGFGK